MINGVGPTVPTRIGQAQDSVKVGVTAETNAVSTDKTDTSKPLTVATAMAEAAPLDKEKIAAIRSAIAQGRYPLDAKAIAQKMISLDLPRGNA